VLLAAAVVVRRRELGRAMSQIRGLSPGWLGVLVALVVAGVVVEGAYAAAITPGVSVRRGVAVQQSTTAANNTVIGSGPIATGLRIAMLRSWDIPHTSIGLTIVVLNLVASYAVWSVSMVAAAVGVSGAAGDVVDRRLFVVVLAVGGIVLTASTALWWLLLCRPAATRWVAGRAQRIVTWSRRRLPRLPHLDLAAIAEASRQDARELAHRHGRRIAAWTVADQALTLALPIAVVRAFGMSADQLSAAEILVAYGLVRLAAALSPVPGGLGITEFGLAALLTRLGGPEAKVVAAVLTYRALTFVLPMATGGACFVVWRWRNRSAAWQNRSGSDQFVGEDDRICEPTDWWPPCSSSRPRAG